jgi:mono/diheme cytochrome c family protein
VSDELKERIPIPTPAGLRRDLLLRPPPFWAVAALLILVALSLVPLVLIAKARVTLKDQPRIHMIQDMGKQPNFGPQSASPLFADGRAMRQPVAGTVARGQADLDDHYHRGLTLVRDDDGQWQVNYFNGLPERLRADQSFLMRGQERFNIYCAPCHGLDGHGNGPINQRALENQHPAWVPPTSLHNDTVRERADGHLYNTIRNGIRNMPAYGSQIGVADRWAIVAYIRALQRSQHTTLDDVPPDQRDRLR